MFSDPDYRVASASKWIIPVPRGQMPRPQLAYVTRPTAPFASQITRT